MIKLDNRISVKQIEALVGAPTYAIIVFDPGWAESLPDWLKGEIQLQRLAQLMKGSEGSATKESLDDYRMGLLEELKEWLWRKRVKGREQK